MLNKIREKAKTIPEGQWVVGLGWDENLFTDGSTIPTIQELDYVAPNRPIFLKRICHHGFLVNSKALEVCQYHPSMEVPRRRKNCSGPSYKQAKWISPGICIKAYYG